MKLFERLSVNYVRGESLLYKSANLIICVISNVCFYSRNLLFHSLVHFGLPYSPDRYFFCMYNIFVNV